MQPDTSTKLYTPDLLALAVELAACPLDESAPLQGSAKSRTCGSEVLFSGHCDADGAVRQIGLRVSACAVGQASAAIFAANVTGMPRAQIAATLEKLEAWLDSGEDDDFLPRLHLIAPARAYPARHAAILLPWRAALDALA